MKNNGKANGLGILAECPYCSEPYRTSAARLVKRSAKKSVIHISCARCKQAMLLGVTKRREGIICAGLLTDCNFNDSIRFLKAEKVSVDDVINTHRALKLDKFLEIR